MARAAVSLRGAYSVCLARVYIFEQLLLLGGYAFLLFVSSFLVANTSRDLGAAQAEPQGLRLVLSGRTRPQREPGPASEVRPSLPPPEAQRIARMRVEWVARPRLPGSACSVPSGDDTRNCFSGSGHGPGTRETWAPALASARLLAMLPGQVRGGVQAVSSIGQTGLSCPPPWGPTRPWPAMQAAGPPESLLGLRMMQGRGTAEVRAHASWRSGAGAPTAGSSGSAEERTMAPSLRAWRPLLVCGWSARVGAAPLSVPRFPGNSGFRPFCIFERGKYI